MNGAPRVPRRFQHVYVLLVIGTAPQRSRTVHHAVLRGTVPLPVSHRMTIALAARRGDMAMVILIPERQALAQHVEECVRKAGMERRLPLRQKQSAMTARPAASRTTLELLTFASACVVLVDLRLRQD